MAISLVGGGSAVASGVSLDVRVDPALSVEYVGGDMVVRSTGDWAAQSLTGRTVGEYRDSAAVVFTPDANFTVVAR